jgi:transposase
LVRHNPSIDVHANQITQQKSQLLQGAIGVFGGEAKAETATAMVDVKTLHAKIGQLTLENDFLEFFRKLCRPEFWRYPTHSAEKRGMDGARKSIAKAKCSRKPPRKSL